MINRDELIDKIVQSPETLTREEMSAIVADPELADIYDTTVSLMRAGSEVPPLDVEDGLADLHSRIDHKRRFTVMWGRVAAVAALCITITAVAAVWWYNSGRQEVSQPLPTEDMSGGYIVDVAEATADSIVVAPLRYDDEPLAQILADVSARYGCGVRFEREDIGKLRFHITLPPTATLADVVEMMNAFDDVDMHLTDNMICVR